MQEGYRHEYKFLISRACAELLKRRLAGVMERDPHAGPSGQYTIRSLYFDDPGFSAYDEKMAGVRDRVKYRLRCYNGNTEFIRLEKKEKRADLTRKTGQTITPEQAKQLQEGIFGSLTVEPETLLGELHRNMAGGLRAAVLVDYDRTPFVCNAGQTRITLDENIRTKPFQSSLWAKNTGMIPVLEPDQVVLEVKFNDFLPGYLSVALEGIPKVQLAVSKYVLCANMK